MILTSPIKDVLCPPVNSVFDLGCFSQQCFAINFDGVDDYGQLATPVTFVTGSELEIGFNISQFRATNQPALFGPTASGDFSSRAVINPDGSLIVRPTAAEGTTLTAPAGSIALNTNYVMRLTRSGNTYTLFLNGAQVDTTTSTSNSMSLQTFGRAATLRHFPGFIYYVKINGTYWSMDQVGQAIQPSLPAGNDMTLFNTVPEQWEQIPCNLRPSENELLTPQIQEEPQDQSVVVGATPSFTVAATVDVGTVEFQWQADTGAGFVDMPSETNATLTLPPVGLVNNGNLFRAQVRANGRSAVSRAALLTVDLV